MKLTNENIGNRIREARKTRKKTQSELGDALGKTAGAVSQLEQGNVQVSVIELARIADFLNKPIEYFFGEEYMGDDVQLLIAVIRKMPAEVRTTQIRMIQSLLDIQTVSDELQGKENLSEEELVQEAKEALAKLRIHKAIIRNIWDQIQDAVEKLEEVTGIDSSDLD